MSRYFKIDAYTLAKWVLLLPIGAMACLLSLAIRALTFGTQVPDNPNRVDWILYFAEATFAWLLGGVYMGYVTWKVAPKYKFRTTCSVFVFWLCFTVALSMFMLGRGSPEAWQPALYGGAMLTGYALMAVHFYADSRDQRKREKETRVWAQKQAREPSFN